MVVESLKWFSISIYAQHAAVITVGKALEHEHFREDANGTKPLSISFAEEQSIESETAFHMWRQREASDGGVCEIDANQELLDG